MADFEGLDIFSYNRCALYCEDCDNSWYSDNGGYSCYPSNSEDEVIEDDNDMKICPDCKKKLQASMF